jgi:outer membrane protein assembly factor BamB
LVGPDGNIYFATNLVPLYALDADGKVLWYSGEGEYASAVSGNIMLAANAENVFVGRSDNAMRAFDCVTFTSYSRSNDDDGGSSSAALVIIIVVVVLLVVGCAAGFACYCCCNKCRGHENDFHTQESKQSIANPML